MCVCVCLGFMKESIVFLSFLNVGKGRRYCLRCEVCCCSAMDPVQCFTVCLEVFKLVRVLMSRDV